MTWTFVIARRAPSLNEHVQNAGPSRWKYAKERDVWCWEFRKVRLDLAIPKATAKRRLTVQRMYCGREQERDYVNLVGGMKVIIDALVLEGLLVDDAPKHLDDMYMQSKFVERGAKGYLRFALSDIANEESA